MEAIPAAKSTACTKIEEMSAGKGIYIKFINQQAINKFHPDSSKLCLSTAKKSKTVYTEMQQVVPGSPFNLSAPHQHQSATRSVHPSTGQQLIQIAPAFEDQEQDTQLCLENSKLH